MADIKLELVNQALTAVGEDEISALTGDTACSRAAIRHYERIVKVALGRNKPKFSWKVAAPSLLTARSDEPLQYRWQRPSDDLKVIGVLYNGQSLDSAYYDIEGRVVRAYYDSDITLRYVYRAPEDIWDAEFQEIIEQRLEALFLRVTERFTAADNRDIATEGLARVARHSDTSQRASRPVGEGSIIQARRGLRPRR